MNPYSVEELVAKSVTSTARLCWWASRCRTSHVVVGRVTNRGTHDAFPVIVVTEQFTQGEKLMRRLSILLALIFASVTGASVWAQDSAGAKRLTILTFSQPVQLPGTTLPAGKYRFEIANIDTSANAVRVSSENGEKVLGTFSTIPSTMPQRDLQNQDSLVMFAERPAGQPQAAREWFYPGRSIGSEFVYPKDQAAALAKANKTSVAASDGDKTGRVDQTGTFKTE
jgi:hypothetical protein